MADLRERGIVTKLRRLAVSRGLRPLEIGHQSRFAVVPLKFADPSKHSLFRRKHSLFRRVGAEFARRLGMRIVQKGLKFKNTLLISLLSGNL